MMAGSVRRYPVSGVQLAGTLVAIVFATAVLPPAAAWSLNRARVRQTEERARVAIERLRAGSEDLTGSRTAAGVVCGPGRLPDLVPATAIARAAVSVPAHGAWLRGAGFAPEAFGPGMPTDAWGRCFLLNVGAWSSGEPVWLLSAGPNGLLDTPPNALELGGDDIGGRLR